LCIPLSARRITLVFGAIVFQPIFLNGHSYHLYDDWGFGDVLRGGPPAGDISAFQEAAAGLPPGAGAGAAASLQQGTWRLATVLVLALLGVSSGYGQPLALAQPLSAATGRRGCGGR